MSKLADLRAAHAAEWLELRMAQAAERRVLRARQVDQVKVVIERETPAPVRSPARRRDPLSALFGGRS